MAECAVLSGSSDSSFVEGMYKFSHVGYSPSSGWRDRAWVAEAVVEGLDINDAYRKFSQGLTKITSRISLVGQACIDYHRESFLIHKMGSSVALFRYIHRGEGVGLMFMDKEVKALRILLLDKFLPDNFFLYWNEATNISNYSAKLLLMFSALETIITKDQTSKNWQLLNDILGSNVVKDCFGERGNSSIGLRNRLVHGEYFSVGDFDKDYVTLIHDGVIKYINNNILQAKLIEEDVVSPQRGFEEVDQLRSYIKLADSTTEFSIEALVRDASKDFQNPETFEYVAPGLHY